MGSKCSLHRFHCLAVSLLFLSILSSTHLRLMAEGRPTPQQKNPSSQERVVSEEEESKVMVRARIGSRPPRCERRCSSCSHCEAIQVPTNPQVKFGTKKNNPSLVSNAAYARGDDNSNYKPMSWKCKCVTPISQYHIVSRRSKSLEESDASTAKSEWFHMSMSTK